jgi:nicotinamide-nucleotide amidase
MVAQRITSVAGASRSFSAAQLSIPTPSSTPSPESRPELIAQHGAVSAEVAKALATGIRLRTGATLGLGVTGIAGPTGATEEKPVGLVHIALSSADKVEHFRANRKNLPRRPTKELREWTTADSSFLV